MEQGRITSSGSINWSDTTSNSYTRTVGMGNPFPNQILTITSNKMKQVKAALFTVTRDEKTNEIIDSEFVKELWVKQKPGVSFELAASFAIGRAINPDTEVIKELLIFSLF
jgi:hypothetical protein